MNQPSEDQSRIYETWRETDFNILVDSVAGAGKTTTLLQLMEYSRDGLVLFLAFNKSIKEEIQKKITDRGYGFGKAMTLHGIGLLTVRNYYRNVYIKANKKYDLLKKLEKKNKGYYRGLSWEDRVALNFALLDLNDFSRICLEHDFGKLREIMLSMGKPVPSDKDVESLFKDLVEIRENSYDTKSVDIDFIDMLYLPVTKGYDLALKPNYLFLDEIQDLNYLQHKLIQLFFKQPQFRKFIGVGDRNQTIYGFAGAVSKSFDIFLSYPNVKELPLGVCYRCPTKIVECANEVFDVMSPFKEHEGIVDIETDPQNVKENSMVICRNTGPLLKLFFQLLGYNKPCVLKGEDILGSIIKFLKPYSYHTVISAKMEIQSEIAKLNDEETDEARIKKFILKENLNILILLANNLADDYTKIEVIQEKVKLLFQSKEGAITLCTIHKSKGLEAEVVYILNENLIPSPFALTDEQKKQEENLRYVGRTRATEELYFLDI